MKTGREIDLGGKSDQVVSVSEFTRKVKALLESGIRPGWVRGEGRTSARRRAGTCTFR